MQRNLRPWPSLIALFSLLSGAALAQEAGKAPPVDEKKADYIRFVEKGDRAKLQTATVHYTHPDGVKLELIGVVHIGDEAYYQKLDKSFKAYDALLFEMVGADPDVKLTKEALRGNKKNPLRFFQLLIGGMMELSFQLEHIDYTSENFVHADMDLETFERMQKERGENIFSLVEKGIVAQEEAAEKGEETMSMAEMIKLLNNASTPEGMKLALGKQFHHIEGMIAGMEGADGSVLVAERNRTALKVMDREIKAGKKHLGIFYGAAHLGDFDKRLREDHGFVRGKTDWNTAWEIDKKTDAEPAEEAAPAELKKAA